TSHGAFVKSLFSSLRNLAKSLGQIGLSEPIAPLKNFVSLEKDGSCRSVFGENIFFSVQGVRKFLVNLEPLLRQSNRRLKSFAPREFAVRTMEFPKSCHQPRHRSRIRTVQAALGIDL